MEFFKAKTKQCDRHSLNVGIVSLHISWGLAGKGDGGWVLWRRAVHRPYFLASVCTITGWVLSLHTSVVLSRVLQIQALRWWKAASVNGFQSHLASCSLRKMVLSANPVMNGCR